MASPFSWEFQEKTAKNAKNHPSGTGCVKISRMAREFHALNALVPVRI
jgi:hypothetical protein